MEKEVKKQKVFIGVLVGIIVVLIGLCVYLLLNKKEDNKVDNHEINTNSPSEKETNNNAQNQEDLSSVADILMAKIKKYRIDEIDEREKDTKYNSVPTGESLYAMFKYYNYKETVIKSEVDTYYKEVYGITPTEYPSWVCPLDNEPFYKYDVNKKVYTLDRSKHGHGGPNGVADSVYKKIEKNQDGTYSISLGKVYTESDEPGYHVIHNNKIEYYNTVEEAVKVIKNNNYMPQYKYTFKKIGSDYYLTAFEIVKV